MRYDESVDGLFQGLLIALASAYINAQVPLYQTSTHFWRSLFTILGLLPGSNWLTG